MKSLVPWMCLVVASASQSVCAEDEFRAYRMGQYQQAAEPLMSKTGKDPVADYYLARLYLYGYGQLKNDSLAMRYFAKSADKGYLPAIQVMAKYSLMQEKNPEQALVWFKKAASAGDVNAQMFVAAAYLFGVGVKPNEDIARKYYIDAAKNGNAIAQFALAENFIDSRHSANNKLGLIWLSKSAASGNLGALAKLGNMQVTGKLVTKDVDNGTQLLNKAAAQQYVPAMISLGDLALSQGDYSKAVEWFTKAANLKDLQAYLHLAQVYLQEKNPAYDPKTAFLWTLKAAQAGLSEGKIQLAGLYQKGIGVTASPELAKQWTDQVALDAKKKNKTPALAQAALWLSQGATDKLSNTPYQMGGIFSAWQNPAVLRDTIYNQAPQLEHITQQSLFKPKFELIQPNAVPINQYYDALVSKAFALVANQWAYPSYPLNQQIQAVVNANSFVLDRTYLPIPFAAAHYEPSEDTAQLMDRWLDGWQKQANFMSVFNQLYFRALLGDAQSQFEIGQMFQYGLGVDQNNDSAIIFYQNAAQQQHLGAEYNLGLLYLQNPKTAADYQVALNWLTDSAFKGNRKAQYVLSAVLGQGRTDQDGKVLIKPNPEQSRSLLYLAAANDYAPAQYELAEYLAREYDKGLNVDVKKHQLAVIRQLYQGAASHGLAQALLPLAFYNAMEQDKDKQAKAFQVAQEQANAGDEKAALLLGLLYDRGIGVSPDATQALMWYQRAGQTPVSQFILGTYQSEGKGLPENKEKGMDQLIASADHHFSYADLNLAVLKQQSGKEFLPDLIKAYDLGNSQAGIVLADDYLSEHSDAEKIDKAREIYKGLAEKGDQYAQLKLAYMMDKGLGAKTDLAGAQHWYTAAAEQGNVIAQYLLGQFYQAGALGQPDYQLARQWYQKAAEQLPQASVALGFLDETVEDQYAQALKAYEQAASKGDTVGIYNLGLMYLYGKGTPVDYTKATSLFTEASNKGLPEAMNQLAGIYFNGLGQAKDEQQALTWYKNAAKMGNSNALYQLGFFSENGVLSKADLQQAFQFYKESADKGNEKALLAVARFYHHGLGLEKDPKKSADIYQQLADKQNAYAQYQLGTFYLDGIAYPRSVDKGKQLLLRASENGSLQARKMLQQLQAQTQESKPVSLQERS